MSDWRDRIERPPSWGPNPENGQMMVDMTVEDFRAEMRQVVKAALQEQADGIARRAMEHADEDRAEGCESPFCRGWLLGQSYVASLLRAEGAEL